MTIIQYFKDHRPWEAHEIETPSWLDVEQAVRNMDNYCLPIVLLSKANLSCDESCFDDEDSFNIIGGNGRIALFHFMGEWQFQRSNGGNEEIRLWDSDQGYYCEERNIIYDINHALRVIEEFYNTGSYDELNNIE